jgi:predicted transcriptional regulator
MSCISEVLENLEDVFTNATRRRIYMHLLRTPGDHYRSIQRALDLPNGVLSYHLDRLVKAGVVIVRTVPGRKRYYPIEIKPGVLEVGGTRESILMHIARRPGISAAEIARNLGVSRRWIMRNLHDLRKAGMVETMMTGGRVECYLRVPDMPRGPEPSPNLIHSPRFV